MYTGCFRRNPPYFGRMFIMLIYTDITEHTYSWSWNSKKKKVFLRRYVLHLFNTIRYSSTAGESILELIAKPNHA